VKKIWRCRWGKRTSSVLPRNAYYAAFWGARPW